MYRHVGTLGCTKAESSRPEGLFWVSVNCESAEKITSSEIAEANESKDFWRECR